MPIRFHGPRDLTNKGAWFTLVIYDSGCASKLTNRAMEVAVLKRFHWPEWHWFPDTGYFTCAIAYLGVVIARSAMIRR